MNKLVKKILRYSGVVVLPLALIYIGGFSIRQGILLGFLIAWLGLEIGKAAAKPVRTFTPYWVRVSPKWYELLSDYKVIKSLEEWQSIMASVQESSGHRVLRDGLSFTVLQEPGDSERRLIHRGKSFTSEFHFEEPMTPIEFRSE